jgi:hypothetical protein
VQQVLAVRILRGACELLGQPVVVADQLAQRLLAFVEHRGLVAAVALDQESHDLHEPAETIDVVHGVECEMESVRDYPTVKITA